MAVCAVLLIHCSAGRFSLYEIGSLPWLVVLLWNGTCKWAVPVFLMCSGALMNAPERELPLSKLFSRYLLRLVAALSVWAALYECLRIWMLRGKRPPANSAPIGRTELAHGKHLLPPLLLLFRHRTVPGPASHPADLPLCLQGGAAVLRPSLSCHRRTSPLSAVFLPLLPGRSVPPAFYPAACICQRRAGSSGLVSAPHAFQGYPPFFLSSPWKFRCRISLHLAAQHHRRSFEHDSFGWVLPHLRVDGCGNLPTGASPLPALGPAALCRFSLRASFCVYLIHPFFQWLARQSFFEALPPLWSIPLQALLLLGLSLCAYLVLCRIPVVNRWLI